MFSGLTLALGYLACSLSAKASTITPGTDYFMTVSGYSSNEELDGHGYDVGDTTITIYADNRGTQGSQLAQYATAFCIDYFNLIQAGATYLVEAQGVGSTYNSAYNPNPGTIYDNNDPTPGPLSDSKLEADAELGLQFNGNDANDTVIQETIWDEGGAEYALNSAQLANAIAAQNAGANLAVTNDIAFLEIYGDGQSYLADVPSSPVPEPSSLVMLGTGLMVAGVNLYRRLRTKLADSAPLSGCQGVTLQAVR
jgi:hypothetical protein